MGHRSSLDESLNRYRILDGIYCELIAVPGVQLDISQLDWAMREFDRRLREKELSRQYRYGLRRRSGGIAPELHDSDSEPRGNFS